VGGVADVHAALVVHDVVGEFVTGNAAVFSIGGTGRFSDDLICLLTAEGEG
jgi:hypothetical protein